MWTLPAAPREGEYLIRAFTQNIYTELFTRTPNLHWFFQVTYWPTVDLQNKNLQLSWVSFIFITVVLIKMQFAVVLLMN